MPIDRAYFVNAEDRKVLDKSQQARFDEDTEDIGAVMNPDTKEAMRLPLVEAVEKLAGKVRSLKFEKQQKGEAINKLKKEIGAKAKAKEPYSTEAAQLATMKEEESKMEGHIQFVEKYLASVEARVGNIVHPSVPVAKSEAFNAILRTHGTPKMNANNLHHHELLTMIDGYESDRGVRIAGHRAYYLKGVGCMLNQALIQYGLKFLRDKKRGYINMQPPYFMKRDVMAATAQLSQFDEELYKVTGKTDSAADSKDDGERYLIATSEQPISALYKDEWIPSTELPIKIAGVSTCFRKEAGSHGKDAWGIFRVHQFEKVEQFIICDGKDSWDIHQQMVQISEEFLQSLGLAYRVINIVSGALNNAAAKKNDIEAWFPTLGKYRELVSCSNCTDYQSRAMNTYHGSKTAGAGKNYVHMLNGTLCATERTLCCLLENYQTPTGIIVPEVLRPWMDGMDFIPFVKPKPAHVAGTSSQAAKKK